MFILVVFGRSSFKLFLNSCKFCSYLNSKQKLLVELQKWTKTLAESFQLFTVWAAKILFVSKQKESYLGLRVIVRWNNSFCHILRWRLSRRLCTWTASLSGSRRLRREQRYFPWQSWWMLVWRSWFWRLRKKTTELCSIGSVIIMMISGLVGNLISMKKRGIKVWLHHWHWANEVWIPFTSRRHLLRSLQCVVSIVMMIMINICNNCTRFSIGSMSDSDGGS